VGKTSKKNKDTKRVKEVTPPDQPLPNPGNADVPVPPPPTQPAIRCGYYVGISEDGVLKFDVIGTQQNLTDLLGLHQIAAEKVQNIVDKHQGGKFSFFAQQMAQLDGKLDQLLGIMGQLTAVAKSGEESEDGTPEGQ
jgi:hypothetical protein